MANFIFSIEDFFSKCLIEHNVEAFFVAPYQRGYKWKSATKFDQVPVLLTDLYEAFKKSQDVGEANEYFLQYITVKPNKENHQTVFEVIDGQQRLTTISLMFYVLESNPFNEENITVKKGKALLNFARYTGRKKHIFNEIIDEFHKGVDYTIIEKQDLFYMLQAVKCISDFFTILENTNKETFKDFIKFIRENVKIILNKEDEYTSAEEVFSSLNSNQVPLTNAYLIKGLLLTKASRGYTENRKKHFKEIMDERAIMGRTWDEMNSWFNQKDVSIYFFGDVKDGLEEMLKLIEFTTDDKDDNIVNEFRKKLKDGGEQYKSTYELFNTFHDNIITAEDAVNCLMEIKHYFKRLQDWYSNDFIYNLLGYYLLYKREEAKNNNEIDKLKSLKDLIKLSNKDLIIKLKDFIVSQIQPTDELKNLKYSGSKKIKTKIQDNLLILSVCPSGEELNEKLKYRFNFKEYIEEEWSLEHIFPQNPDKDDIVNIEEDSVWILEEIKNRIKKLSKTKKLKTDNKEEIEKLTETKQKIEKSKAITSNEIEFIYNDFNDEQTHSLGNMALLSKSVNSALSNGFFNAKRKILLSRINKGNFVPKHTIDVFSKMLEVDKKSAYQFDTTLVKWTTKDLDSHFEWIKNQLETIKTELSK